MITARSHVRWDGKPKVCYDEEGARQAADRLTARDRESEVVQRTEAYECPHCPAWHVGRVRYPKVRMVDLWPELGERVCGNLKAENSGSKRKRMKVLMARGRKTWFNDLLAQTEARRASG